MKVLLVEDEEFIRDLFKRQLDLSGFTTDAFGTGQEGLTALTRNNYDLALLDIMLPDINGLQILQNIRQNANTKNLVVVLLTNLGQDAVIKQGFELGADGYLVKAAYTPDQIVQEVKNILQKKGVGQAPAAPAAQAPMDNPMGIDTSTSVTTMQAAAPAPTAATPAPAAGEPAAQAPATTPAPNTGTN
jgi:DNA-binding response OmpR family regulator